MRAIVKDLRYRLTGDMPFLSSLYKYIGKEYDFDVVTEDPNTFKGPDNWYFHKSWLKKVEENKIRAIVRNISIGEYKNAASTEAWECGGASFIESMADYIGKEYDFEEEALHWYRGPGGYIYHVSWLKRVEENKMTRDDLKTGMKIEFENGQVAMVLLGTKDGNIISGGEYGVIDCWFNHNLTTKGDRPRIRNIYQPEFNKAYLRDLTVNISNCEKIWSRPTTHTLSIDGNERKISDESYGALKDILEELK